VVEVAEASTVVRAHQNGKMRATTIPKSTTKSRLRDLLKQWSNARRNTVEGLRASPNSLAPEKLQTVRDSAAVVAVPDPRAQSRLSAPSRQCYQFSVPSSRGCENSDMGIGG
jgi:hypothetical protein